MYKNTILPLLAALLFLWSCGNEVEQTGLEVIKVDVKNAEEVFLSDIASDVKYIPLETTADNLISRVMQIDHNDEFIFISDYESLYKFSIDGTFIKKLGANGYGPGEFVNIHSMAVDWENQHIFVASNANGRVICLDFNGDFVKDAKTPFVDALHMINGQLSMMKTAFGLPSEKEGRKNNVTHRIELNSDLSLGDSALIRSLNVPAGYGSVLGIGVSFLSEADGKEFAYFPTLYKESIVRDTLYQIIDNRRVPHTKVDFGITDRTNQPIFIKNILRTKTQLIIDFSLKRYSGMALVDIPTKEVRIAREGFQDDFFGTGEAKLVPWNSSKDEFYFIKDAYDLEGVIDGVNVDGNPYIFIASLKE